MPFARLQDLQRIEIFSALLRRQKTFLVLHPALLFWALLLTVLSPIHALCAPFFQFHASGIVAPDHGIFFALAPWSGIVPSCAHEIGTVYDLFYAHDLCPETYQRLVMLNPAIRNKNKRTFLSLDLERDRFRSFFLRLRSLERDLDRRPILNLGSFCIFRFYGQLNFLFLAKGE